MSLGFASIGNELYYVDKMLMLLDDVKSFVS